MPPAGKGRGPFAMLPISDRDVVHLSGAVQERCLDEPFLQARTPRCKDAVCHTDMPNLQSAMH